MRFGPDARIPRGDASLGSYAARLDAHHGGAAHRAAAEVDEVPIVGHAVLARVLAHRRDEDAVVEFDGSQDERREEAGSHREIITGCNQSSRYARVNAPWSAYARKDCGRPTSRSCPARRAARRR